MESKMEIQLIEFVKKHPFIYNTRNKSYRNIYLRNLKFMELSKQMNLPVTLLKSKWRFLRDTYKREVKKANQPSSNGAKRYKKEWKWFKYMTFLSNEAQQSGIKSEEVEPEADSDFCSVSSAFWKRSRLSSNNISFDDEYLAMNSSTPLREDPSLLNKAVADEKLFECSDSSLKFIDVTMPCNESNKLATKFFFDYLAEQVEHANITPKKFAELQIEMLEVFNKVVLNLK